MTPSFDFMARLGLDAGADARAIRRAYARELKLIDQAADPDGFQQLRTCYEQALAWAAHAAVAEAAVESEAMPAAPLQAPAPMPALSDPDQDPFAQAQAVFTDFCAALAALAASTGPMRALPATGTRLAPWTAALHAALDDPRLQHLEARACFEALTAALLASGWQSGHEWLLLAASAVFGWDADRGALARLGEAGLQLDAALAEHAALQSQDILPRTRQREVLGLLRDAVPPSDAAIEQSAATLYTMVGYFPHLLAIVVPRHNVEYWMARCPREVFMRAQAKQAKRQKWGRRADFVRPAIVLLLFGALRMMGHSTGDGSAPAASFSAPMGGSRRPPSPIVDQPFTQAQEDAIRARIDYRPTAATPPGAQWVRFQVYLDEYGNLFGMNRLAFSGDPAFSAAVERAIRAASPFPEHMVKTFQFSYRIEVGKGGVTSPGAGSP